MNRMVPLNQITCRATVRNSDVPEVFHTIINLLKTERVPISTSVLKNLYASKPVCFPDISLNQNIRYTLDQMNLL